MQLGIISVFPEMFSALNYGVTGKAIDNNLATLSHFPIRNFSTNKFKHIDDSPYGGGPGMLLQAEPINAAILAAKTALPNANVMYLTPTGIPLTQPIIATLAKRAEMILLCGRYEGIDERVITEHVDEEWSIADYVLSGGELAAMVLVDAMIRLLAGALGNAASVTADSFANGLLDHPHFTRPQNFSGKSVPNVLLSGNHKNIADWREKQALGLTWLKRPDILCGLKLSVRQQTLLAAYIKEYDEQRHDEDDRSTKP